MYQQSDDHHISNRFSYVKKNFQVCMLFINVPDIAVNDDYYHLNVTFGQCTFVNRPNPHSTPFRLKMKILRQHTNCAAGLTKPTFQFHRQSKSRTSMHTLNLLIGPFSNSSINSSETNSSSRCEYERNASNVLLLSEELSLVPTAHKKPWKVHYP